MPFHVPPLVPPSHFDSDVAVVVVETRTQTPAHTVVLATSRFPEGQVVTWKPPFRQFPYQPDLDFFARANQGPPPGPDWTTIENGLKVVSNQVQPNTIGQNSAYWTVPCTSADQEAYIGWLNIQTDDEYVVFARFDPAGGGTFGSGYGVRVLTTPDTYQIVRYDASVATVLATYTPSVAVVNGDFFGIRCQGSKIELWTFSIFEPDWSLHADVTDTTYAGTSPNDKIGFRINAPVSATGRLDDFGGGPTTSAPAGFRRPQHLFQPPAEPRSLRDSAVTVWGPAQSVRASLETRPNFPQVFERPLEHRGLRDASVQLFGPTATLRASAQPRFAPQVIPAPAEHPALRKTTADSFGPSQAIRASLETRPLFPQQAGPAWTPLPQGSFQAWGPLGRDAATPETRPIFPQQTAPVHEHGGLRSAYFTQWGPVQAIRASLETRPNFGQVIERPIEPRNLRDAAVYVFGPTAPLRASAQPRFAPQVVLAPLEHPRLRASLALSFGPPQSIREALDKRPLGHQVFAYPDTGPPTRRPSAFVVWGPPKPAVVSVAGNVIPHFNISFIQLPRWKHGGASFIVTAPPSRVTPPDPCDFGLLSGLSEGVLSATGLVEDSLSALGLLEDSLSATGLTEDSLSATGITDTDFGTLDKNCD